MIKKRMSSLVCVSVGTEYRFSTVNAIQVQGCKTVNSPSVYGNSSVDKYCGA